MKYQYYVYAFELNDDPKYVYVGQSYLKPEERRLQHINGPHKSRAIRHCKIGKLRPDLYSHLNPIATRDTALKIESQLAEELRSKGYNVEGGH
jgi:hypothetical protein